MKTFEKVNGSFGENATKKIKIKIKNVIIKWKGLSGAGIEIRNYSSLIPLLHSTQLHRHFQISLSLSLCLWTSHTLSPRDSTMGSVEKYHVIELVGEGSFGKVYKGRRKHTGQVLLFSLSLSLSSISIF